MAACALVPFDRLSKREELKEPYKKRQGEKPATYDIIPSLLVTDKETFRRRGLLISREQLCFWELVDMWNVLDNTEKSYIAGPR